MGGDAKVELAAADALDAIGGGLTTAVAEYHGDLSRHDDERQRAVVHALIERIRADAANDAAVETHAEAFHQAMAHLEQDRQAAWLRYSATADNLSTLHEIAGDLRRLAVESLSLNDETKRYFGDLIQRWRTVSDQRKASKEAEGVNRPAVANPLIARLLHGSKNADSADKRNGG